MIFFVTTIFIIHQGLVDSSGHEGCFSTSLVKSHSYYQVEYRLTWESCLQFCDRRFTTHAGVQAESSGSTNNRCFCGNNLDKFSKKASSESCSPCVDMPDKFCGGEDTLSLYKLRDDTTLTIVMAENQKGVTQYIEDQNITKRLVVDSHLWFSANYIFTEDEIFYLSNTKDLRRSFYSREVNEYVKSKFVHERVTGFTLDWTSRDKIYFVTKHQLYMLTGEDGDEKRKVFKFIEEVSLYNLCIDPYVRRIFFTAGDVKLHSYNLPNKTYHHYEENGFKMKQIYKTAVDVQNQLLYVAAKTQNNEVQLISITYDGSQINELYSGRELKEIWGLDVFRNTAIWVNFYSRDRLFNIYKCDLAPKCQNVIQIYGTNVAVNTVIVYHPEKQTPGVKYLCSQLGCSHTCESVSLFVVKCTCPPNLNLTQDNKTCQGEGGDPGGKGEEDDKGTGGEDGKGDKGTGGEDGKGDKGTGGEDDEDDKGTGGQDGGGTDNDVSPQNAIHEGCFSTSLVKSNRYYEVNVMLTWEECLRYCSRRLTTHAAVQAENSHSTDNFCFCGNNLQLHSAKTDTCQPCLKMTDKLCGGPDTMSMYRLRDSTPFSVLMPVRGVGLMQYTENTSKNNTTRLLVPDSELWLNVGYIYTRDELYYLANNGTLFRSYYNYETKKYMKPDLVWINVTGFTLDWTSLNSVYYGKGNAIYRITDVDRKQSSKVLEFYRDSYLYYFSIDPHDRRILFTEDVGPKLFSYSMDNGTFYSLDNKMYVNDIMRGTMDTHNQLFYLVDRYDNKLHLISMAYDGTKVRFLYSGPELTRVKALDAFNDRVVWVNYNSTTAEYFVYQCQLTPKCQKPILIHHTTKAITVINIYHPEAQTPGRGHLCSRLDCSHGCLLVTPFETVCTCPTGMVIADDRITCKSSDEDIDKLLNKLHSKRTAALRWADSNTPW